MVGMHAGKVHNIDCNLGLLLIDYFRFYGRQLDYSMVGVSCNDGGYCYMKSKTFPPPARFRKPASRGDRFSIMDPLDSSNDVAGCARPPSRSSANIPRLHIAGCQAPPSRAHPHRDPGNAAALHAPPCLCCMGAAVSETACAWRVRRHHATMSATSPLSFNRRTGRCTPEVLAPSAGLPACPCSCRASASP